MRYKGPKIACYALSGSMNVGFIGPGLVRSGNISAFKRHIAWSYVGRGRLW
jgi:hypothetical protein